MTNAFIVLGLVMCWRTKNEIKCEIWIWKMQKEVSDSVIMCSLGLAWQSALRQRLRRRLSRFFRAKTRESTLVPHPNTRRTSERSYTSRSSTDNTLLPVFPPLIQSWLRLQSQPDQMLKAKRTCSPHQLCSAADSAGRDPAHTRRQQDRLWSKTRGNAPKTWPVSRCTSLTPLEWSKSPIFRMLQRNIFCVLKRPIAAVLHHVMWNLSRLTLGLWFKSSLTATATSSVPVWGHRCCPSALTN